MGVKRHSFVAALLALALSGCTYTETVSLTNVPKDRSHRVEVDVKKYIILGFTFDNDQVLQITTKLRAKCPSGYVRGVLTKDILTEYLWIFFYSREQVVSGYCVKQPYIANSVHPDPSDAPLADLDRGLVGGVEP